MLRTEVTGLKLWMLWAACAGVGALAALLVFLGNPGNMGICGACFLRDTAGNIYLAHSGKIGGGRKAGEAHRLETLDLVAERTSELALDVEGAAAHAGGGAHLLHARIG